MNTMLVDHAQQWSGREHTCDTQTVHNPVSIDVMDVNRTMVCMGKQITILGQTTLLPPLSGQSNQEHTHHSIRDK